MTVNIVLLAVLAGIIGLVLGGFTGWHLYLAGTGQTTIECLEKTRYLSPLKKSMEQQLQRTGQRTHGGAEQSEPLLDQLKEIHANALPGVTRPEEGEERISGHSTPTMSSARHETPATESLRRSYREIEEQRERDRYAAYLDEQDSQKLPHAFDLGWRRNLSLLFGSNWLLWPIPVQSTAGDGWTWEVSEHWLAKRDEVARERVARQQATENNWANGQANGFGMRSSTQFTGAGRHYYEPPVQRLSPGRRPHPGVPVQMQRLDRGDDGDEYDTSSDEEHRVGARTRREGGQTANWNDVPADFLPDRSNSRRGGSRGRQKGD
ncbi:hypothetical protein K461DRAFT_273043 [Myriangium duriaei CBS 260.36]|uniref:Uncharacterized protein n=1 Tax=Myriangium duriaei CBS 260.36 TaxID=1168546 RepID=A0A9P4JDP8_9PEZI|nr:hypothetical protein K461DRAFT_273043 [Myriangium duriaei CBS 260.36]